MLGVYGDKLCLCDWVTGLRSQKTIKRIQSRISGENPLDREDLLDIAEMQLDEYFYGRRREFDLDVMPIGTEFQQLVWQDLTRVSYGQTASYQSIADSIGHPRSVRAVANAIGANPLSIFIPCHRIIGSSGSLTGYAGGQDAKRYLLSLEAEGAK